MFYTSARRIERFFRSLMPDRIFYQYQHFKFHKKFCNFKNPKSFSEKIYHRMRYPLPVFSMLADKVLVRDHIARVVGEQYLVPVYFSCRTITTSTFDKLPNTFVMKANHSAGQVKIITDKSKEDIGELAKLANDWLLSDFSSVAREKHYKDIKPQIIFEHALLTHGHPPADYKFNVFNEDGASKPYVFIQYMQDRFGAITQDLFLEDWTTAPFVRSGQKPSNINTDKPQVLNEMLYIAKKLSEDFGYMRVDFYLHEGRIYIGELTLTPAAGGYKFDPFEYDVILGKKFCWPEQVSCCK
ncbi:ATP-grasp fold amidoligase family protein [Pseudomonas fluorescens]|uniref:Uncharacterized protein n=1 Tax=Pseudomonas fluorescens TaxID=294 RepID=A0A5E7CEZ8_PSEFL|nr:ATP-grasp fold amidoligase family protein [Pseudomonas fluorescens]VVO03347.1 hypothetical protein PS710_02846 [Pseudomonas fluorescens]